MTTHGALQTDVDIVLIQHSPKEGLAPPLEDGLKLGPDLEVTDDLLGNVIVSALTATVFQPRGVNTSLALSGLLLQSTREEVVAVCRRHLLSQGYNFIDRATKRAVLEHDVDKVLFWASDNQDTLTLPLDNAAKLEQDLYISPGAVSHDVPNALALDVFEPRDVTANLAPGTISSTSTRKEVIDACAKHLKSYGHIILP